MALKAKESALLIEEDLYFLFGSFAQIKVMRKMAIFFPLFPNSMFCFFFFSPFCLITYPEVKAFLNSSECSAWTFSVSGILLEFYTGGTTQAGTAFSLAVSEIFI